MLHKSRSKIRGKNDVWGKTFGDNVIGVTIIVVLVRGRHALVSKLHGRELQSRNFPEMFSDRSPKGMKTRGPRNPLHSGTLKCGVEDFSPDVIGIKRPAIVLGTVDNKVIGTQILPLQVSLQRRQSMVSDVPLVDFTCLR